MKGAPDNAFSSFSRGWRLIYWASQIAGWGTYSLLGIKMTADRTGGAASASVVWGYVLFFGYSIALSHLFSRVIERRHWLALPPLQALLRIASGTAVTSTLITTLVVLVSVLKGDLSSVVAQPATLLLIWVNISFGTAIWTGFYVTIAALFRSMQSRRQAEGLEHAMVAARLRVLESQLSPHFLFNCLNSLRGMIAENPATAQDMVTRLANLLRHSLSREGTLTIALSEELEVVDDYLALEGVRFDERLRVRREIAPESLAQRVPAMTVQLLVENAVKHGISTLPAGGEVVIRTEVREGKLCISVLNTGSLVVSGDAPSTKVGLANLRERLSLYGGQGASLRLRQASAHQVEALVTLPALPPL